MNVSERHMSVDLANHVSVGVPPTVCTGRHTGQLKNRSVSS